MSADHKSKFYTTWDNDAEMDRIINNITDTKKCEADLDPEALRRKERITTEVYRSLVQESQAKSGLNKFARSAI
jgi:hypothetical protein